MSDTSVKKVEEGEAMPPFTPKADRKMLLKLDLLLVPMCCGMYLLAFLDRANIGNARVAGMQADLGMTDIQYQTAITVTYVPYIAAELPSNLVFRKIGPRIMMPVMCLLWGVTTTAQSQVKTYGQLLACRFFLGLFEGGLFPNIVLYLTGFYRPHELQIRVGLFFSAAALSGAFSGLLAAAIEQMEGLRGLHGWSWIFLLEGVFTICFALFGFYILPNNPLQVKSLSISEREYCTRRLELDAKANESTAIAPRQILSTFTDLSMWLYIIVLFFNGLSLFGLAYFTPTIVAGFKYSTTKTQLYTVPPFAIAFVVTMIGAVVADRFKARGAVATITTCLSIIGFAMFYASDTIAVRYAALCFLITGVYATAPSLIAWVSNNNAPHTRRATAVALAFISTNAGGIVSTWIYPTSAAPKYNFATLFNLSVNCVMVVAVVSQIMLLRYRNRKKVTDRDVLLAGLEHLTYQEQYEILGDRHPDFIYTL